MSNKQRSFRIRKTIPEYAMTNVTIAQEEYLVTEYKKDIARELSEFLIEHEYMTFKKEKDFKSFDTIILGEFDLDKIQMEHVKSTQAAIPPITPAYYGPNTVAPSVPFYANNTYMNPTGVITMTDGIDYEPEEEYDEEENDLKALKKKEMSAGLDNALKEVMRNRNAKT